MKTPRVLSIQDISCYGQCSLTVALPILSAMGIETAILPTAILSTHTTGFSGFTFHDMKDELPKIVEHWHKENIRFDGVYTGYLGNVGDVQVALGIAKSELNRGPLFVDPAFGDHGKLYPGFDDDYVAAMVALAKEADVLLPNLTEACALLKIPYVEKPSEEQIREIIAKLHDLGAKAVVLKGIGSDDTNTGIVVSGKGNISFYTHERMPQDFHGTGDVFASTLVGAYFRRCNLFGAAMLAADFTCACIKNTMDDPDHAYGVHFERTLPMLGIVLED